MRTISSTRTCGALTDEIFAWCEKVSELTVNEYKAKNEFKAKAL